MRLTRSLVLIALTALPLFLAASLPAADYGAAVPLGQRVSALEGRVAALEARAIPPAPQAASPCPGQFGGACNCGANCPCVSCTRHRPATQAAVPGVIPAIPPRPARIVYAYTPAAADAAAQVVRYAQPQTYVRSGGGGHTHTCGACGTTWDHSTGLGRNCPNCGRAEFSQDSGGSARVAQTFRAVPLFGRTFLGAGVMDCSSGKCVPRR